MCKIMLCNNISHKARGVCLYTAQVLADNETTHTKVSLCLRNVNTLITLLLTSWREIREVFFFYCCAIKRTPVAQHYTLSTLHS